ncbi:MAG: hypothetical protein ACR2N3_15695 [Pyrinomonadaceae bacterium]
MQYKISINATVKSTLSIKELENKLTVCLFDIETSEQKHDGESIELEVIEYDSLEIFEDSENGDDRR